MLPNRPHLLIIFLPPDWGRRSRTDFNEASIFKSGHDAIHCHSTISNYFRLTSTHYYYYYGW